MVFSSVRCIAISISTLILRYWKTALGAR